MNENNNPSDRELLIRIDERQRNIHSRVQSIERAIIPNVERKRIVKTIANHENRIDFLERWQIKVIATATTIGATAGAISSFVYAFIENTFFRT